MRWASQTALHMPRASREVIREQIRAARDDGAPAGVALGFVEVFAVVRR
jgi:hypothetical protein